MLGTSAPKVNEDITNLRAFGEEALESMSRMGIGYRELRQFRKLPEESSTALIEAAKQDDKESLLDLAEELIARQCDEKEQLARQLADKDADLEASRQRAADLKTARDELEEKLHEERFKPITDSELAERTRLEATSNSSKIARELIGALQEHLPNRKKILPTVVWATAALWRVWSVKFAANWMSLSPVSISLTWSPSTRRQHGLMMKRRESMTNKIDTTPQRTLEERVQRQQFLSAIETAQNRLAMMIYHAVRYN